MIEEQNVQILRRAYALWNDSRAASVDHWLGLLAEDVTWRSIGGGSPEMEFTRSCSCKEDVVRYLAELGEEWEMLHYTADEFIAQGDRVVMLGRCAWRHRRTGREVASPKCDVIRMRDERIVEFFEFFDTAAAFAAAK